MIELLPFDKCPICSRAGRDNRWYKTNHNSIWWEKTCSNYDNRDCGFHQFYWKSYSDPTLRYIRWHLSDFTAYTYTTAYAEESKNVGIFSGTRFYHKKFPRGENVQGPFQDWYDFVPDWDNLDKLNTRLRLLRNFE